MKIKEVLKKGISKLNQYNIEESNLKAKILLQFELNVSNEYLASHMEEEIEHKIIEKFNDNIEELIKGKPIQYITNYTCFYGLDFYVDENVLIPRPDTEILVEEVINISNTFKKPTKILDICTGSGAIAISITKNTNSYVTASDISKNALEIAKKNAIKNQVNINFIQSDMFKNINDKFDIIVSNPPYIETETIKNLSKEVRKEPIIALDGGEDGLEFYKILAREASKYLVKGGMLAVEIGYNQKKNVSNIFKKSGFYDIVSKRDFGNNDRIVLGKWR